MRLQYAAFSLPLYPVSDEQEEVNRFLRGHQVVQTRKELAVMDGAPRWAILVEYLDRKEKSTGEIIKGKVDYKEILNDTDFLLFSKLREVRKKLAEENGLPVYAVCTNDQLAEIAKRKPKNLAECMKIDGIGQSKADKYVPSFIECISSQSSEKPVQSTLL